MRTVLIALGSVLAHALASAQAVQVLHEFDTASSAAPRDPQSSLTVAGPWMYGTTTAGGTTGRGVVYRVSRATGLLTVTADVPGPPAPFSPVNSALVEGPDGQLYGTTSQGSAFIIRVDPDTGAAASVMPAPPGLGQLARLGPYFYAFLTQADRTDLVRYDPAAGTITTVTTVLTGSSAWGGVGDLVAAADGLLYYQYVYRGIPHAQRPQFYQLHPVTGAIQEIALPQPPVPSEYTDVQATTDGRVFVQLNILFPQPPSVRVDALDLASGAVSTVCQFGRPGAGVGGLVIDGFIVVTLSRLGGPALLRCDPATGTVIRSPLLTDVVSASSLVVAPDGLYYGTAPGGTLGGGYVFRISAIGAPPEIDTDGDGLDNTWESRYGLSPSRAGGNDGAAGDPDGDGRSNIEERAAGTHPRGTVTRYLAEGATGTFFSTRITILNPTADPALVVTRFLTDTHAVVARTDWLPPLTPLAIEVGDLPGLGSANVSTVVEADRTVVVDRTMRWGAGGYGSHSEMAVASPSASWFIAEGSTSGDFALFYLLQNPGDSAVVATVRYLRPFGQPVVERTYSLPPASRTTIAVDAAGPELSSTDVSAAVTATAPIIVERAMYLTRGAQLFAAGHASAAVTAPALEWFLAEGATGPFFDLFILIANPTSTSAAVQVDYFLAGGGVLTRNYTVSANSRHTIWVDDEEIPAGSGERPLRNAAVSTRLRSTNGVPIVVERTMWWPGPETTPLFWYEAHSSTGATAPALRWAVAGCEVGGADGAETYVLIANPDAREARVVLTALFQDGGTAARTYELAPRSRTSVALGGDLPQTIGRGPFGVIVEGLGVDAVPVVVERATYSSPGGVPWASGTNTLASPIP